MSRKGFVVWPRELADHPALRDFADRAAFLDLVADAAWRPETVRRGRAVVALQRGQVLVSVRELSDRWGWSVGRVRRFLERLTADTPAGTPGGTLADTVTGADGTVLTVRNYSRFSGRGDEADTPAGTMADTLTGTPADTHKKEGRKETRKEGSPSPSSGARADVREDGAVTAPVTPEAVAAARELCERLGLREGAVPAEAVAQWLGEGVNARSLVAWATAKRTHLRQAGDVVRYIGRCVQVGQVPEVSEAGGGGSGAGSGGGQVIPLAVSTWRNRLGALRRLGRWPVGGLSVQAMRAEVGDGPALELVREVFGPDAGFGRVEQAERGEVA